MLPWAEGRAPTMRNCSLRRILGEEVDLSSAVGSAHPMMYYDVSDLSLRQRFSLGLSASDADDFLIGWRISV